MRTAAAKRLADAGHDRPRPTLVLPLDQAEELFSVDAGPQADQFLVLIADLMRRLDTGDAGLVVAATIRTDRYEAMQNHPALDGIGTTLFDELKPMPAGHFSAVITGPAARVGHGGQRLTIAPSLVNRLLDDATEGADTLPLLALTLARLYTDYATNGELTVADYEAMGGMRHVVQNAIDEALAAQPAPRAAQLDVLRAAFIPWMATINPDNDQPVRRVARYADLPEPSRSLIDALVDKRLLVKDERDGETVVEVALESLLRQWDDLAGWLRAERQNLVAADDIGRNATAWATHDRDPAWLLTGTRLTDAETLAAAPGFRDLLAPALDFLVASRRKETAERDEEKRRQQAELETAQRHAREQRRLNRRLTALVALGIVLALVVAGALGIYREDRKANAERMFSQATGMLAGDVDGNDVQAFHELLSAYDSVHDDGPLVNALRARFSTIRISDVHARVIGATFSAQSHRLAVATADNHIRLWRTSTRVWREHPLDGAQILTSPSSGQVAYSSIAISPDGNLLAGGRSDGKVELWHLDGPSPQSRLIDSHRHEGVVTSVAFSPDGQRIASAGGADNVIDMSNMTGAEGKRIPTGSEVFTVAFDPRSDLLASGGSDGDIRFWNPDGSPERTIPHAHANGVMTLAFNPIEPVIASGGADQMVRLWHTDSLTQVDHPLSRHTQTVEGVAFNDDGSRIVSASADHTVQLWDAHRGEPIGDPMIRHTETVWAATFVGDKIVSGSNDRTIRVWDGIVGQPISSPLRGHQGAVTGIAINNAGDRIASASTDKTVRLWNLYTGHQIAPPFVGPTGVVTSVAFSPRGDVVAAGSADGTVRLWRTDSHKPITTLQARQPVNSVAFSPQGDRLASAGGDCQVTLWDLASANPTPLLCNDRGAVLAVAFNPRGDRLVSGGVDGKLRLWDPATARQVWERDTLLALSEQTRRRFDLASGRPAVITSVAYSPDGTRIASGSSNWRPYESPTGLIQRWDAATGQPAGEPMHPPEGSVMAVAYSPQVAGKEASRLVSGDSAYAVRLWDADSPAGEQLGGPLNGHQNGVVSVVFSPDAACTVSGSGDGTVRIWPNSPTKAPKDALRDKLP